MEITKINFPFLHIATVIYSFIQPIIHSFIPSCFLRHVNNHFQSEYSIESNLALLLSVSSTLWFSSNHIVAAYVSFLVLPSLLHPFNNSFINVFKKAVLTYEITNPNSLYSLHFNYDIPIHSTTSYISSLSHATGPLYNDHLTRHRLSNIYRCRVSDSNIYVLT